MMLKMRQRPKLARGQVLSVICFLCATSFQSLAFKGQQYFKALGGYHNIYEFLFAIFRIYLNAYSLKAYSLPLIQKN